MALEVLFKALPVKAFLLTSAVKPFVGILLCLVMDVVDAWKVSTHSIVVKVSLEFDG